MLHLQQREQMVILLVEDREDDVLLFKRACARAGIANPIFVLRDGREAVRYLAGTGPFRNHEEFPLPGLMVLDLKMPEMDGFEFLAWVRGQPGLRALRVAVLTSSQEDYDAQEVFRLGGNSFMVKPFEFIDYIELARQIKLHWIDHSVAPEIHRSPENPLQRGEI